MKRLFLSCVFILGSTFTFAQTHFGLKGGLNLAKLNISVNVPGFGSGSNSSETLTGFHAGVYLSARLSDAISIQPELIYSAQGGGSSTGDIKVNYLNVPLMLVYHANPRINLHVGPQLGFVLSGTSGGQSIANELNPIDFGLGFGLGVEVGSGVSLGFRYNLGLSNIAKVDLTGAPPGTSITMTNNVMQFSFAYKLTKPKRLQ